MRERGITTRPTASRSTTPPKVDGKTYQAEFHDTPGHVDSIMKVSRSLAACEGALLVVTLRRV